MKSLLFKLFSFTFISLFFLGCNENSKTLNSINSNELLNCRQELNDLIRALDQPFMYTSDIPNSFNFCTTNEAALNNRYYDTRIGRADYTIPIPRGSNLRYIRQTNNDIFYECDGRGTLSYNDRNLINRNISRGRLSRRQGHVITVHVTFKNFIDDCTKNNPAIFQEIRKKSEIGGQPLILEDSENK